VHAPAGGSVLILTGRISSGVEKKIHKEKGGVQTMLQQMSGLIFSRMIC
jgi:hypothetical protein